jgi:hypothetical protein
MDQDEREKKVFDFAADLTKQLITLSTGIVTLTLLLSKDVVGPRLLAVLAWAFFLLSTLFGLWALMALTGTLAPIKDSITKAGRKKLRASATNANGSADESQMLAIDMNVRLPSGLQIGTFGVATVLTLVYVFVAFSRPSLPDPHSTTCCCPCVSIPPKATTTLGPTH